jgi:Tol biopolymer transport system component
MKQCTIEQFLNTTSIGGASFSPDEGRILFSSNKTGIWNAYTVPIAGGPWTAVTKSTKDSTYAVSYFPRDARMLVTRDQGGNELNHLFVVGEDGAERDLTPGDRLKAEFAGWTHDGSAFYVASNERDAKFFDIYRYDAKSLARTLFFENRDGYLPDRVSDDGQWVSLGKVNTTNDSDIFLWNARTKTTTRISEHSGDANFTPADFDPASKYFYYLTDAGSEFTTLKRYPLAGGPAEEVQKAPWDITSATFSHNGRYRATVVNQDGRPAVSIVEADGTAIALPSIPNGGITSARFARSETKVALYVNGDRSPNNLYVLDLGTKKLTKLTESLSPDIDAADLVDADTVRFKSRDGMVIPNVLWKPQSASASAKAPALVWVHGGPGGQTVQSRLRGARHQQPGQLGVRQNVFCRRRQEARPRASMGLRGCQEVPAVARLRRPRPHRDHRRQLRRLHGPGRARVPAPGVQGRRRSVRRRQLDPDPRKHPVMVGGATHGALRRDGRPGEGPGDARIGVAAAACEPDPPAAAGAAGRERSTRAEGRIGRSSGGGQAEWRAGGIHRVPGRRPRVHEEGQPDCRLQRDSAVPRPAAEKYEELSSQRQEREA